MLNGPNDITDEEFDKYFIPYNKNFHNYMIKYIVPEVFAFQLANSYFRNCLCDASLDQHYNSMCDVFNGFHNCLNKVEKNTVKLLQIKYNLKIINVDPIKFERFQ